MTTAAEAEQCLSRAMSIGTRQSRSAMGRNATCPYEWEQTVGPNYTQSLRQPASVGYHSSDNGPFWKRLKINSFWFVTKDQLKTVKLGALSKRTSNSTWTRTSANRPSFAAANQVVTLTLVTNERVVWLGQLVAGQARRSRKFTLRAFIYLNISGKEQKPLICR